MNYMNFTDAIYIPIEDLSMYYDSETIKKVILHRNNFKEVISLDGMNFAYIVESPALIKKRFLKNLELKGMINIDLDTQDYILELAKLLVQKGKLPQISIPNSKEILDKYKRNNNDLTILTSYLVQTLDAFIDDKMNVNNTLHQTIPELSSKDNAFVKKFHNINRAYKISDYQTFNNCVYETARKALDRMTNYDLYTKEITGKKFVYRPTKKLNKMIKGEI